MSRPIDGLSQSAPYVICGLTDSEESGAGVEAGRLAKIGVGTAESPKGVN
jgi:hypothetical protein